MQLEFTASAARDLRGIGDRKHQGQLARKLDSLLHTPLPHDARPILGEEYRANGWNFDRVDMGKYRIVYDHDEQSNVLTVLTVAVIGRRNDRAVYRLLKRRHG